MLTPMDNISTREMQWVYSEAGAYALSKNLNRFLKKGGSRKKAFRCLKGVSMKHEELEQVIEYCFDEYCTRCNRLGHTNRKTGGLICPVCDWE